MLRVDKTPVSGATVTPNSCALLSTTEFSLLLEQLAIKTDVRAANIILFFIFFNSKIK